MLLYYSTKQYKDNHHARFAAGLSKVIDHTTHVVMTSPHSSNRSWHKCLYHIPSIHTDNTEKGKTKKMHCRHKYGRQPYFLQLPLPRCICAKKPQIDLKLSHGLVRWFVSNLAATLMLPAKATIIRCKGQKTGRKTMQQKKQ